MTTITNVDDLLRVPESSSITVNSATGRHQWVRQGETYRRDDGVTLPYRLFTGAAGAGHITIPDDVALITNGEPDLTSDAPVVDEAALRRAREEGQRRGYEEFRDHMLSVWDGQNFNAEEVNDIFEHFGLDPIPPGRENVTVTIEVSGITVIDYAEAERMVESNRLADVPEDVQIGWTWLADRDFEVDEGDCACDEVDNECVEGMLDNSGFTYESFDYSASCSNCR